MTALLLVPTSEATIDDVETSSRLTQWADRDASRSSVKYFQTPYTADK